MPAKRRKKEFAVIGLGLFGSSVAHTLAEHGHDVLGAITIAIALTGTLKKRLVTYPDEQILIG